MTRRIHTPCDMILVYRIFYSYLVRTAVYTAAVSPLNFNFNFNMPPTTCRPWQQQQHGCSKQDGERRRTATAIQATHLNIRAPFSGFSTNASLSARGSAVISPKERASTLSKCSKKGMYRSGNSGPATDPVHGRWGPSSPAGRVGATVTEGNENSSTRGPVAT